MCDVQSANRAAFPRIGGGDPDHWHLEAKFSDFSPHRRG